MGIFRAYLNSACRKSAAKWREKQYTRCWSVLFDRGRGVPTYLPRHLPLEKLLPSHQTLGRPGISVLSELWRRGHLLQELVTMQGIRCDAIAGDKHRKEVERFIATWNQGLTSTRSTLSAILNEQRTFAKQQRRPPRVLFPPQSESIIAPIALASSEENARC